MPRSLLFLVLVVLLLVGGIYFLSTLPTEQPAKTVEVDVQPGGNAS